VTIVACKHEARHYNQNAGGLLVGVPCVRNCRFNREDFPTQIWKFGQFKARSVSLRFVELDFAGLAT